MRCKFCLTIGMSLAVLSTSSIEATLLPGNCIVERAGDDIEGRHTGGEIAIHAGAGCGVGHVLEIDLLTGIAGANVFSGARDRALPHDPSGVTLYSGIVKPELRVIAIGGSVAGTRDCDFARCASAAERPGLPFGARPDSGAPSPAVLWLFLALLWLFAIVLRELLARLDPASPKAPLRSVEPNG